MRAGLIKAIETVYNGYRFRSRLEARWAVFFDALGIEYEYEPEGYEYNNLSGDNPDTDTFRWLPDFRLPKENGLLVEVKGGDEALKKDWEKLCNAVDWNHTPASDGLLILGNIPNPDEIGWGRIPVFSYLEWDKGVNCDFAAFTDVASAQKYNGNWIYDSRVIRRKHNIVGHLYDIGGDLLYDDWTDVWNDMPDCVSTQARFPELLSRDFDKLKAAYTKARQARFEHGETP